ncbi:MAG TPA: hypothetical protein VM737_04035 [Gemmatimonadota bacterium]|nr:hypothetical protein [Gemmatimonadota bacterium]
MTEDLTERLDREAVGVECSICRHRQWLSMVRGRCDQCGSEISLYPDRRAAREALEVLAAAGRVAYLSETAGGLFAVVTNRSFRPPGEG